MSSASLAFTSEGGAEGIGFYTAVSGQVSVTHPSETRVLPVKLHDQVLFKDVIQTHNESRTKAFFQDDSILTVGENSRVEIDEYIYDPSQNVRRAIVKLVQGQVRALVSKVFKANGSKFEVHTPSAVAAARGTYFTVWVENGQSGIINIGEKGRVDFTSGGTTVAVDPGFFSIAEDGKAPSIPIPHHLGETTNVTSNSTEKAREKTASTLVMAQDQGTSADRLGENAVEPILASSPLGLVDALVAVERTTLRDSPLVELPGETLRALNLDDHLVQTLLTLTGLSSDVSGGSERGTSTGTMGTLLTGPLAVGAVSVGTTSTSGGTVSVGSVSVGSTTVAVAPVIPLVNTILATPPAVINGALNLLY